MVELTGVERSAQGTLVQGRYEESASFRRPDGVVADRLEQGAPIGIVSKTSNTGIFRPSQPKNSCRNQRDSVLASRLVQSPSGGRG